MSRSIAPSLIALLFVALACAAGAHAEPVGTGDVRVIDGDTIAVRGMPATIRLIDYDAPERWHPRCAAETAIAETASARLNGLIREEPLDLSLVACSCPAGTAGTRACNYGRLCGILRSRGRDVGAILIAERLAVAYHCGALRCPRKANPWCAG